MTGPKIAGANAGQRLGFAGTSRVVLRHLPGVTYLYTPGGRVMILYQRP